MSHEISKDLEAYIRQVSLYSVLGPIPSSLLQYKLDHTPEEVLSIRGVLLISEPQSSNILR
jgi:hypothetical protein